MNFAEILLLTEWLKLKWTTPFHHNPHFNGYKKSILEGLNLAALNSPSGAKVVETGATKFVRLFKIPLRSPIFDARLLFVP